MLRGQIPWQQIQAIQLSDTVGEVLLVDRLEQQVYDG